jgi:hypothetical protein
LTQKRANEKNYLFTTITKYKNDKYDDDDDDDDYVIICMPLEHSEKKLCMKTVI